MRNKIMHHKHMPVSQWKAIREQERATELSKARGQDGMNIPKFVETGLVPAQEVELLLTLITDLTEYNYIPIIPPEEAIKKFQESRGAGKGWEQYDRCQQRFQVFPGRRVEDGALTFLHQPPLPSISFLNQATIDHII